MKLNEEAIYYIAEATKYANCITKFESIDHPMHQNAIIFCLKAIGTCLERAIDSSGAKKYFQSKEKLPDTLLFWRNIYYLRNALTHHFDLCMINGHRLDKDSLTLLKNLHSKITQCVYYFQLIMNAERTDIELRQKFKVFFDFHELTDCLREKNPRENRSRNKQIDYIKSIINAINIIKSLIPQNFTIDELERIERLEPAKYFAIQNLLDHIAIITNPNETDGQALLNQKTQKQLRQVNPKADQYFRILGDDRNQTMHGHLEFDKENIIIHVNNLLHLKLDIEESFGIVSEKKQEVSQSSHQAIMSNLSLTDTHIPKTLSSVSSYSTNTGSSQFLPVFKNSSSSSSSSSTSLSELQVSKKKEKEKEAENVQLSPLKSQKADVERIEEGLISTTKTKRKRMRKKNKEKLNDEITNNDSSNTSFSNKP